MTLKGISHLRRTQLRDNTRKIWCFICQQVLVIRIRLLNLTDLSWFAACSRISFFVKILFHQIIEWLRFHRISLLFRVNKRESSARGFLWLCASNFIKLNLSQFCRCMCFSYFLELLLIEESWHVFWYVFSLCYFFSGTYVYLVVNLV